jgi:hypothetical protein
MQKKSSNNKSNTKSKIKIEDAIHKLVLPDEFTSSSSSSSSSYNICACSKNCHQDQPQEPRRIRIDLKRNFDYGLEKHSWVPTTLEGAQQQQQPTSTHHDPFPKPPSIPPPPPCVLLLHMTCATKTPKVTL